jgi:hypothetical protein
LLIGEAAQDPLELAPPPQRGIADNVIQWVGGGMFKLGNGWHARPVGSDWSRMSIRLAGAISLCRVVFGMRQGSSVAATVPDYQYRQSEIWKAAARRQNDGRGDLPGCCMSGHVCEAPALAESSMIGEAATCSPHAPHMLPTCSPPARLLGRPAPPASRLPQLPSPLIFPARSEELAPLHHSRTSRAGPPETILWRRPVRGFDRAAMVLMAEITLLLSTREAMLGHATAMKVVTPVVLPAAAAFHVRETGEPNPRARGQ